MNSFCRLAAHRSVCALLIVAVAALDLCAQPSEEIDPAQRFVEALRDQRPGYFQTALDFLEHAKDDPAVSDEFKRRIGYEQGMTLYFQALAIGDTEIYERTLEASRQKLDAFAKANPDSDWGAKARGLLARFLMLKGQKLMRQVESLGSTDQTNREKLLVEARRLFADAQQTFEASEKFFADRLKALPAIAAAQSPDQGSSRGRGRSGNVRRQTTSARRQQAELAAERQRLRAEWLLARHQIGEAMYEEAMTWPAGSEQTKGQLGKAVEHLHRLYEKNDLSIVGLDAHLLEGRCYQALGELKKAIGCYQDLVDQPAELPVMRSLMAQAIRRQAECYTLQDDLDTAIAVCSQWLDQARGAEIDDPNWLAVRYQLALAHQAMGLAARQKKDSDGERAHLKAARTQARTVARAPSVWQKPASVLLAALGQGETQDEPKDFEQAFEAGREAISLMTADSRVAPLTKANNPRELPIIEKRIEDNRAAARRFFQLALKMAEESSQNGKLDTDKVVVARYYLAYLDYLDSRWYETAVVGDFIARRHPNNGAARSAAKLALLSFEKLRAKADADHCEFESSRLDSIARYILQQWPNEEEAAEAYRILVDLAIQRDDLKEARQLLEKVDPAHRGGVTLQIGLAEWNQYVRSESKEKNSPPLSLGPTSNEGEKTKGRSQRSLEEGLKLVAAEKSPTITPTVAVAALTLAKLYVDNSQYEQAIQRLEDPRFGALSLVQANHPAVNDPFAEEAFRTALRAYVSVQPPRREKAISVMDAMEKRLGDGDSESAARITRIYIGLGLKLKRHLDDLVAENKQDEAESVKTAFVDFLDRSRSRQSGASWASKNWIAQMYYSLGKPENDTAPLKGQSREFCGKAEEAYREILAEVTTRDDFAPGADAILGVKNRLAQCLATQYKFDEALALYGEVLAEKPTSLLTQRAAAMTFQLRGDIENAKWFDNAIQGGLPDDKTGANRVWGWNKLSLLAFRFAQRNPAFYKTYFDARYQLSLCQFKQAMKLRGQERVRQLAVVAKSIENLDLLSSGEAWKEHRPEFEEVLKDIQKVQKKKPIGFSRR